MELNCYRRLKPSKPAVGVLAITLAFQVPVISGCSQPPIECPQSDAGIPDLTLDMAKSLLGTTVTLCTASSTGTTTELVEREIVEPWDALLAVDGTHLPAAVSLPGGGRPADCRMDASPRTYVHTGGRWLQARTVGCAQLD